jgi:hypothetical protein
VSVGRKSSGARSINRQLPAPLALLGTPLNGPLSHFELPEQSLVPKPVQQGTVVGISA